MGLGEGLWPYPLPARTLPRPASKLARSTAERFGAALLRPLHFVHVEADDLIGAGDRRSPDEATDDAGLVGFALQIDAVLGGCRRERDGGTAGRPEIDVVL